MLKKRIIPIMLLKEERLVKSIAFKDFRDVGDPVKSASVYNSQYADELVILNISPTQLNHSEFSNWIENISKVSFMPLSVGGGIRSLEDAEILFESGADKVILNSICYDAPDLITSIASKYGTQAVVVCIDIKSTLDHQYTLYSSSGMKKQNISLEHHILNCEKHGAGEFIIQAIDHDGSMRGFNMELFETVTRVSSIPIIGCGGSGNYEHLKTVFLSTNISALACGSLFNFSDSNPIRAKNFLSNYGIPLKIV